MAEKIRLQKYMSMCGAASRRSSEEMIRKGRVQVNGRPVDIGDKVDPQKDIVTIDGVAIGQVDKKLYIALHKPRGFVSTMQDERGRRCVADLVEDAGTRVYPIGRLDKDSEGLLLMTNDGALANKVMHPSGNVAKTYRVTIRPAVQESQLNALSTGIVIDGKKTAPAKVKVLEAYKDRAVLEIVLYEGRNREIRKMCEAIGLEVARLKRVAEGPVRLGMLPQGKWRELTPDELRILKAEIKKAENKSNEAKITEKKKSLNKRTEGKKADGRMRNDRNTSSKRSGAKGGAAGKGKSKDGRNSRNERRR